MSTEESRVFDIGDDDPGASVAMVESLHFDDVDEYTGSPLLFVRTHGADEWKGYLFGGKVYYRWAELARRFGPLREATL